MNARAVATITRWPATGGGWHAERQNGIAVRRHHGSLMSHRRRARLAPSTSSFACPPSVPPRASLGLSAGAGLADRHQRCWKPVHDGHRVLSGATIRPVGATRHSSHIVLVEVSRGTRSTDTGRACHARAGSGVNHRDALAAPAGARSPGAPRSPAPRQGCSRQATHGRGGPHRGAAGGRPRDASPAGPGAPPPAP